MRCHPALLALVAAACLVAASTAVRAAEEETVELPSPEATTGEQSGASANEAGQESRRVLPQEVRTRRQHGQIITEYQRGSGVYLMTVKPRVGPTQYWNDPDGDGQFQRSTSDDIDENINLPKWRLGGW